MFGDISIVTVIKTIFAENEYEKKLAQCPKLYRWRGRLASRIYSTSSLHISETSAGCYFWCYRNCK